MSTALSAIWHELRAVLSQWRWFNTGLAVLVGAATLVAMGTPLAQPMGEREYLVPLVYNILQFGFPLVFAVLWADRAVDRHAAPWKAYGIAVLAVAVIGTWPIARALWPLLGKAPYWELNNDLWLLGNALLFHSLGVAAYAQWRGLRRAQERLQRDAQAQAVQQQQLVTAQLLALQARVDPQLLFDSLRLVDAALAEQQTDRADQKLADLIDLLRALQPSIQAQTSTLAREVALVHAYARVSGEPGLAPPWLRVEVPEPVGAMPWAPMVLLPLLRQLAAEPAWQWRVQAQGLPPHVRLTVSAPAAGPASTLAALRAVDWPMLSQRWQAVHGQGSRLHIDASDPLQPCLRMEVAPS
jgi:hypothetical protein